MSGSGQSLFRGFGYDMPTWNSPSVQLPGSGTPPPAGYVGPGSAQGWTSDTAVDTSYLPRANMEPTVGGSSSEASNTSSGFDWQGLTTGIGGGLLNLFRGGGQQGMYPPGYVPPQPGVPVWVWVAIPVALVGVIAYTRMGKKRSVAGYRRRKSRR